MSSTNRRLRILLVEDDVTVGRVISALLVHWGYEVEEAQSGAEALAAVRARAPAAILVDLSGALAEGLRLVRELKSGEGTPPTPIIGLHAESDDAIEAALAAGCVECLGRVTDTQKLLAALRGIRR